MFVDRCAGLAMTTESEVQSLCATVRKLAAALSSGV